MIRWYREPAIVGTLTDILNYIFTVIFLFEAFIRIMCLGPRGYFKDGWNIFDFISATVSIIGIIISRITTTSIKVTSIIRSFRILRLFRLFKRGGSSLN